MRLPSEADDAKVRRPRTSAIGTPSISRIRPLSIPRNSKNFAAASAPNAALVSKAMSTNSAVLKSTRLFSFDGVTILLASQNVTLLFKVQ